MGTKNSDETVKYNLMCKIRIEGVVSQSDIVGALFGQTEGLLDSDMDLKQLQKSSRVGRIKLEIREISGVTKGKLIVPSSLNKVNTAILAATLESVDRVGPCACSITLDKIVDVRKAKSIRTCVFRGRSTSSINNSTCYWTKYINNHS